MKYIGKYLSGEILLACECSLLKQSKTVFKSNMLQTKIPWQNLCWMATKKN